MREAHARVGPMPDANTFTRYRRIHGSDDLTYPVKGTKEIASRAASLCKGVPAADWTAHSPTRNTSGVGEAIVPALARPQDTGNTRAREDKYSTSRLTDPAIPLKATSYVPSPHPPISCLPPIVRAIRQPQYRLPDLRVPLPEHR